MRLFLFILALSAFSFMPNASQAHCQIPCGIFDDARIFDEIEEHIVTIEKSANEIKRLQSETPLDIHTITRWTINKENHAQKIQDIASEFFLAQRIKAPTADASEANKNRYEASLFYLHSIITLAMRSKQNLDQKFYDDLRNAVSKFEKIYFMPDDHTHNDE